MNNLCFVFITLDSMLSVLVSNNDWIVWHFHCVCLLSCQNWHQIGDVSLPITTCAMRTWPRQMHRCCSAMPATNMATSFLMPT